MLNGPLRTIGAMRDKPLEPVPQTVKRVLRQVLPSETYRRYFTKHEDESLRVWAELSRRVAPDLAILDIGAFHGGFALVSRSVNPTSPVYAFEPNPVSLAVLREACAGREIEIIAAAVGDHTGVVDFVLESRKSRVSLAIASDDHAVKVDSIDLDSWTHDRDIRLGLAKIDVEGFESAVIRGARRIFTDDQPILLCEVLRHSAGAALMEAMPAGYVYVYVDEMKGLSVRPEIKRVKPRNKNWLLVPNQRVAEVMAIAGV